MATNYPTSLDSLTNPTSTDGLDSPDHAAQHANSNDAIEALQTKVGIDDSADTDSLDYKVSSILGAWEDWTPSYTNITVGNGTVIAKYTQVGKTVNFYFNFTLGSTSSISSGSLITLPVTPSTNYGAGISVIGTASLLEYGLTLFAGGTRIQSSTQFRPVAIILSGASNTAYNSITATLPFTWASGDKIICEGTYEAA